MDELITRLQKASSAVYLAAEKPVADDISELMKEALRELQSLREENEMLKNLEAAVRHLFDPNVPEDEGIAVLRAALVGIQDHD